MSSVDAALERKPMNIADKEYCGFLGGKGVNIRKDKIDFEQCTGSETLNSF